MNTVESTATARAENGKAFGKRCDNIRIGGLAFNISGRIIQRGCADTEFKAVKRLIIGDDFINGFIKHIQIFLQCLGRVHFRGRSVFGNNYRVFFPCGFSFTCCSGNK